jgi:hypothetical protein
MISADLNFSNFVLFARGVLLHAVSSDRKSFKSRRPILANYIETRQEFSTMVIESIAQGIIIPAKTMKGY